MGLSCSLCGSQETEGNGSQGQYMPFKSMPQVTHSFQHVPAFYRFTPSQCPFNYEYVFNYEYISGYTYLLINGLINPLTRSKPSGSSYSLQAWSLNIALRTKASTQEMLRTFYIQTITAGI
jgi:hypothetical protein